MLPPSGSPLAPPPPFPGLWLAWADPGVRAGDGAPVDTALVVGRGTDADWTIPDRELSGRHFEVRRHGARLLARDLGSTNGTAAQGKWLTAPREIEPGDLLRAGSCLFLVHPAPGAEVAEARRRADIPRNFAAALRRGLPAQGIDPEPVVAGLRTDDLEALALLDSSLDLAALEALVAALVPRLRACGDRPGAAFHYVMLDRHPDSPVYRRVTEGLDEPPADEAAAYEQRRALILEAYTEAGKDLARLEAQLRARGIPCSRRWLALYLERWGARAMRAPRRRPRGG